MPQVPSSLPEDQQSPKITTLGDLVFAIQGLIDSAGKRVSADDLQAVLDWVVDEPEPWQTIDTAPKDGTRVFGSRRNLVAGGTIEYVVMFNGYQWITLPGRYAWTPDYWMPLPKGPTT